MLKMRKTLYTICKLFKLTVPISKVLFSIVLLCYLLLSLIPLIQIFVTVKLVDQVALIISEGAQHMRHGYWLTALQGVLLLVYAAIQAVNQQVSMRWRQKVQYELDQLIISKTISLPLVYFEMPSFQDKVQMVSHDLGQRCTGVILLTLNIIKSVTMLFGYMGVLASFHWSLLVAMALFVVPAFMIHFKLGYKRYLNIFQLTPTNRQLLHMRNLMRDKVTIQEIKVYRSGGYLLRIWSELYWKQANEQHKLAKQGARNDVYIEGTSVLCISGITALFIAMGHTGNMSIGNFAALTQAVLSAQTALKSIALDSGKIFEEALMVEHLFELLDLTGHTSEEEIALPLQQGIDVRNVFFKYPNSDRHVLNNISFQIQAGERVAVVGDNGAGKSTLVKCLIGLYPVADGAIHYDGALLKSGQAVPRVTTLFQNFVRYNLTVRENIGMSNVESLSDELMIRSAAELATAGQFIEQLPESYNALLGNLFTGGNELSGGQWQKIALSRALFRNSDIVVLDEPTASLDPLTEASLIDSLLEHTGGKTVIIVTHRLSCCKIADRILVLKDGTLVEQGNHEQLMMQNGYYAQMYHSQAKWYVQV